MANAARSTAPGAIPRGCYASYRGNLAGPPRKVEQNNRTFAAARMGVNMAAPDVASEEREKLHRMGQHHRVLRSADDEAAEGDRRASPSW